MPPNNFQRMNWIIEHFKHLGKADRAYIIARLNDIHTFKPKEKIQSNNPNEADI